MGPGLKEEFRRSDNMFLTIQRTYRTAQRNHAGLHDARDSFFTTHRRQAKSQGYLKASKDRIFNLQ